MAKYKKKTDFSFGRYFMQKYVNRNAHPNGKGRGIVIFNNGTYRRDVHGEIGRRRNNL